MRTNRAARFMYTRKGYRLDPILSEGDGLYYFKPLSPPSVCHPQPHVCHVTTAHQPFDTRIFRRECVSLARAGYRVTLIAPHTRDEVVDGVHVVALQREPRVWRRRLVLTRQAATLARAVRADLYHFHDPELIPEMRRLARTTGKPVVWDVHEYYSDAIGYRNSLRVPLVSRLGARWFDRMERDACRRDFAGTVVISEEMAARYRPLGRPCVVSGNFPDLDALPRPTPSQRSPRPLLVSSGAQFGPRGAFAVADAFRIARKRIDCQLAIWGTFHPTTLPDDLRQIALADGAPPNDVWIEGPVPWKTLVGDYLPRAWAGCVLFDVANPNYRRGLPNRFFELWAAGVPLLVTGGTEVARLVAEHGGGVVLPDNSPETLATAFVRLVEDPAAVARAGAEGRHAVESIYNWENSRRQLLSLYEQLGVRPGMGLNRSEPTAKAGSI